MRTSETATEHSLPLTEADNVRVRKLLGEINDNTLMYKSIVANKLSITINQDGKETSFQSSLRMLKDSVIEVSARKFSIPAGKVYLTKDSVYYINNLQKEYVVSDYELVNALIDCDLDYCFVQAILSNSMCDPNIEDVDKLHKVFSGYETTDRFILTSIKSRKYRKIEERGQYQKLNTYRKKYETERVIYRKYEFDKDALCLRSIAYSDLSSNRNLVIEYSDFKAFEDHPGLFPRKIKLAYKDNEHTVDVFIQINKLSLDAKYSPNIRIPDNYKEGM
ncbi:MAG: DUF4292 domain-containing protein [Bacteroidales bacterium]